MAKQIKKEEVYESDLLIPLIKQGQDLLKVLDANAKAMSEFAKEQAKVAKNADSNSAKGIKNLEQATKKLSATQKEKLKIDKQREQLRAKLNVANSEAIQKNEQLKVQLSEQRKVNKQLAREELNLVGAYEKQSKKLNELRKQYKNVALEKGKTSKEAKKLAKEVNKLDEELKDIDASVGQFQRNVGNYTQAFSKLGATWKNLIGIARNFGLALGGIAIARDAFNVIVDFDQAQANLAAITGKSTEELAGLTNQAKELGATTSFTASEVAGLQTELAKLGFDSSEIEQSTESILKFAKATGADLSEAASLTGSALRAFGLDAAEAERVTAVLGVSTTKTALDFSKLNNSLSTVAPVANAFGFSIEETTALLGQLANAGFDASSSATATRNILLNLADANGDLAKALGRPIKGVEDLAPALQELNDKLGEDGLAKALELTDKRSVAAFKTFLQGADDLQPLVDSLTDVEDELTKIAETQDNTVRGALDRLRSAWEGYILGTGDAAGASEKLREVLDFLAENLDTIIDAIIRLGRAFLAFRSAAFLVNKIILPLNAGFKILASGLGKTGKGLKGATTAFKGLNSAMKANVVGLVAVAVIELVDALDLFTSRAEKAQQTLENQRKKRAEGVQETSDFVVENINKENEALNERLKTIQQTIAQRLADAKLAGKSSKELNDIKKEEIELKKQAFKEALKENNTLIERLRKEKVRNEIEIDNFKFLQKRNKELAAQGKLTQKEQDEIRVAYEKQVDNIDQIAFLEKAIEIRLKNRKDITDELLKLGVEFTNLQASEISNNKKGIKQKKTEIDLEAELLKLQIKSQQSDEEKVKLERQLADLETKKKFNKLLSEKRTKEEIEKIKELLDINLQLNKAEEERNIREIRQERLDLINDEIEALNALKEQYKDIEFELVNQGFDKEIELLERRIKSLNQNIKTQQELDELNKTIDSRVEFQIAQIDVLTKKQKDALKEQIRLESDKLKLIIAQIEQRLSLENLSDEERQNLISQRSLVLAQLEQLEKNYQAEVIKIEDDAENRKETIRNNANDQQIKNTEKFKDKQLQQYKELADAIVGLFETISDIIEKQLDRQIQKQENFIQASQRRQDFLKQQAAEGNQIAKDSLAAEEAREAAALAKKQQAERRKRQLESANLILKDISNLVGQGKSIGEATSISVASFQAVRALLSNLPAFLDGTEDTGKNGKGLDGKGGFMSILHPNERVMTKEQNAMVGGMSNWELAELAQNYNNGVLTPNIQAESVVQAYSNKATLERLDKIEKAIIEKPVTNIEMGKIMQSFIEIHERTVKGRKTTTKTHRLR